MVVRMSSMVSAGVLMAALITTPMMASATGPCPPGTHPRLAESGGGNGGKQPTLAESGGGSGGKQPTLAESGGGNGGKQPTLAASGGADCVAD